MGAASKAIDLFVDLAEIAVDSGAADGVVKEIPIVKSVVALTSALGRAREEMLVRDVASFLGRVDNQLSRASVAAT